MGQDKNSDKIERFWDRFIALVRKNRVNEPFDRWYVVRAEEYKNSTPCSLRLF